MMMARNPVLPPDQYFPDGEPHFIRDELYVYPSCDREPGKYCSAQLYVVHSKDLANWVSDGPVFQCSTLNWPVMPICPAGLMEAKNYDELPSYIKSMLPKHVSRFLPFRLFQRIAKRIASKGISDKSERLLYAPDALTYGGKSYLFFCTSDGCEGVAFADDPAGPFSDPIQITMDRSGEPISGIDPAVFRDEDGKTYLYWGQINACGAELTDDLTQVREETLVNGLLTEKEHGFHEGSSMRKINGTYYFIFADSHRGKPTALGYATSGSPLGPFEYQGIIIDNDGCDPETWNNHGSIECINGQWYVFYHRSTGNSRYLRRMCAERITIEEDGRIQEVQPTSIGMGQPYKIGEPMYGYQACKVSANAYIDGDRLTVKKGKAEVVYRYIDSLAAKCTSLTYDGTGNALLQFSLDARGELTVQIQSDRDIRIRSFTLH